jgi:hypothetical protein
MRVAVACVGLLVACGHAAPEPPRASPASPVPVVGHEKPRAFAPAGANLLVFVGRKLDVQRIEHEGAFDVEYLARFEVLKVVYGSYPDKEISFSSYTHTGEVELDKHELGLVYVSKYDDRFVQQKYIYQTVYPTHDGRWAGCGDPYAKEPEVHRHGVKPEPIELDPPVRFDITGLSKNNIAHRYPTPWFRIDGDTATCLMGNYTDELFQVMAEGVLKARGVFGPVDDEP